MYQGVLLSLYLAFVSVGVATGYSAEVAWPAQHAKCRFPSLVCVGNDPSELQQLIGLSELPLIVLTVPERCYGACPLLVAQFAAAVPAVAPFAVPVLVQMPQWAADWRLSSATLKSYDRLPVLSLLWHSHHPEHKNTALPSGLGFGTQYHSITTLPTEESSNTTLSTNLPRRLHAMGLLRQPELPTLPTPHHLSTSQLRCVQAWDAGPALLLGHNLGALPTTPALRVHSFGWWRTLSAVEWLCAVFLAGHALVAAVGPGRASRALLWVLGMHEGE